MIEDKKASTDWAIEETPTLRDQTTTILREAILETVTKGGGPRVTRVTRAAGPKKMDAVPAKEAPAPALATPARAPAPQPAVPAAKPAAPEPKPLPAAFLQKNKAKIHNQILIK